MNVSTPASEDNISSGAVVHSESDQPAAAAGRRRWVSSLVMAGRLLLLLAAALAVVSAFELARARDRGDQAAQSSNERYVCPMHPEVVARMPGECPICRMALERVTDAEKGTFTAAASNRLVNVAKRSVITQLVRAPAWLGADGAVTAVLHKDDLVGLAPGMHALFFGTKTSRAGSDVRLSTAPPAPWDASTLQVRFEVVPATGPQDSSRDSTPSTSGAHLDTGWLDLAPRPRELLVVAANAVLYTVEGPYVVAVSADGKTFSKRPIEIGRILDSGYVAAQSDDRFGAIVVLSGLREGERVVVEDTFFLDAERRLQEGRRIGPEVMP